MALNTPRAKTSAATDYAAQAIWAEASSSTAGATAGASVSGINRVQVTWTAGAAGVITGNAAWSGFITGQTVQSANMYTAQTGGSLHDTIAVSPQSFAQNPGSYDAALTVQFQ